MENFVGPLGKVLLFGGAAVTLAFFIFLIIRLARYLTSVNIEKLEYTREFEESGVYEDDEVYLIETIYNPTIFPMFFLNADAYLYTALLTEGSRVRDVDGMISVNSKFHLLPFMQIKRRHKIKCIKRGYYKLENTELRCGKIKRIVSAPTEIYVYPKLTGTDGLPPPTSIVLGDIVSKRRLIENPFSVSGVREYRPGDPFNSINFKATAKSGILGISGIRVNGRDHSSSRTVMIYMNFIADPDNKVESKDYFARMEYGLSFAASIVHDALSEGYMAGFAANCTTTDGANKIYFTTESGETHLKEILREMAKIRPMAGMSASALLEYGNAAYLSNADIIFITQYTDSETDEKLERFRRLDNNVTVITLTSEDENGKQKTKAADTERPDITLRRRGDMANGTEY